MPRPSRAAAHHLVENAPTATRAPSRASGFVLRPFADIRRGVSNREPCGRWTFPERWSLCLAAWTQRKSCGSATLPGKSCPILFDLPLLSIGLVAVGKKQSVGLSDIYIEALTRFNRDYKAITVVKLLVCTPVTKAIRRIGAHTSLSTVCVYSRPQEIEPLIWSGITVLGPYSEDCRCYRH
jgi:hypothetical protein